MRHDAIAGDHGLQLIADMAVVAGGRPRAARPGGRVCLACGKHRALFFYRGAVKADRDHNLCLECYRAEGNRLRARFASRGFWMPLEWKVPARSKMVGDRAGLMLDLQVRRRRAQILARHALEQSDRLPEADALAS